MKRLQMFLFFWICQLLVPFISIISTCVNYVYDKNPKALMMFMAALTSCNNPLWLPVGHVQQKLCPYALSDWAARAVCTRACPRSRGLISFPKKFIHTKCHCPPKEHKHTSFCHQWFQAQLAEAVRLIHWSRNLVYIAFNLHGLAYKYICGQSNVVPI